MYRFLALVVPVCLALVVGCQPSKNDIDKSIRDEMKTSMNVEITSTNLTKQADGGYTGTATAANGDVYDVTVDPPKGGRTEWKASPSQSMLEKQFRTEIENQTKIKVKSINLTKQSQGVFSGTAEMENGLKLKLSTEIQGKDIRLKIEP